LKGQDGGVHAIRLHAFGPAENLRFEQLPDVDPGPGQVRVAVASAGVHLIDTTIRRGVQMGPIPLPDLPAIPGREVAGTVEAVGDGVDASWLGRPVVAHLGPHGSGGYAERTLVDVARLHERPDTLDADAAVAAIGTGRTALMILDAAAVGETDTVLIPAAAGGLGTLLVQAARHAGAEVVALAGGPEKVEIARRAGATFAIDYRDAGWADAVRDALDGNPISLVLDGVGGDVGRTAQELLGPNGRSVIFGWSSGEPVGPPNLPRPADLRPYEHRALEAFATGTLKANVHPAFPLRDAAAAHTALETRATAGKVVLRP
jgi:NADPH:quinone reductase